MGIDENHNCGFFFWGCPRSWHQFLMRLFAIFLLIVINAFFVTAEFAIVSVRKSRIDHLVMEGDIQASTVQSLQKVLINYFLALN